MTRDGDPALLELHRRLLRVRGQVEGDAETLAFDEDERWLAVRRGAHVLACNFARGPRTVALPCSSVVLATHADTELQDGAVTLPPLAGALLR